MDKVLYEHGGLRVEFARFANRTVNDQGLLRAYYYHCLPRQSPRATPEETTAIRNKEKFFHALQFIDRFELRLGHLAYRGVDDQGQRLLEQKGVDVQMAVDILSMCYGRLLDQVVLVTGDADLVPVVQKAKDLGVVVRLVHGDGPNSRVAERLWHACDERLLIDREMLLECQLSNAPDRDSGSDH